MGMGYHKEVKKFNTFVEDGKHTGVFLLIKTGERIHHIVTTGPELLPLSGETPKAADAVEGWEEIWV